MGSSAVGFCAPYGTGQKQHLPWAATSHSNSNWREHARASQELLSQSSDAAHGMTTKMPQVRRLPKRPYEPPQKDTEPVYPPLRFEALPGGGSKVNSRTKTAALHVVVKALQNPKNGNNLSRYDMTQGQKGQSASYRAWPIYVDPSGT